MTIQQLHKQYKDFCQEFITKFCRKQGLDFDGWVGSEVGGIAEFIGQYFFNISDVILDLTTKQPKGLILSWQDDGLDYALNEGGTERINYKSYTMGLRYADLTPKPTSPDPIRVQRKRTKGWRNPPNTVYVGRGTKFGNPFRLSADGTIEAYTTIGGWETWSFGNGFKASDIVTLYEDWVKGEFRNTLLPLPPKPSDILLSLRGKNLSCFCSLSAPCHADVLLKMAKEL